MLTGKKACENSATLCGKGVCTPEASHAHMLAGWGLGGGGRWVQTAAKAYRSQVFCCLSPVGLCVSDKTKACLPVAGSDMYWAEPGKAL